MPYPVQTAIERVGILGSISDDPGHLVRTFLSPASRRAAEAVLGWMENLGMETGHAPDGTIRGILPGTNPAAKPLLLGSHLDTVIDAGKYDGALGVIAALAALESLETPLPFPVHVLGFSDEEGMRFHTTYLGSTSVTRPLDAVTLATRDATGRTMAEVIETEGWHEGAGTIHYEPGSTLGYVELHIEQGRVLESSGEPACAVSTISGQSRISITVTGRTDHAGTTPMDLRRDALAGAAECILAIESHARDHPPLVATVGCIRVHPGASNSVPQSATFTLDLRHPDNAAHREHLEVVARQCAGIADRRRLEIEWNLVQTDDSVPCDPTLTALLLDALEATTGSRRILPSGAGHDGVAISAVAPIAMLFIRCRDGLSHHPDEHASDEDIATGIRVLTRFLQRLRPAS